MSKKTRQVQVGSVRIGGGAPVSVQSMTNTDTADVEKTLSQIRALTVAGADIVRVSVYNEACADAVRALVDGSPVPLVADIHFDYKLAIKAVENGIHKLRINPGNIGGEKNVRILADCVKAHHIPVRIGVNSGSVEKDILAKYGGPTPQGISAAPRRDRGGSAGAGENQERNRHRCAAAGWHRRHDPRFADGRSVPRTAGRH